MPLAIFDLDNTLIDRAAAFHRWAGRFVTRRALPATDLDWLIAADGDGFVPRATFLAAVRERYRLDESLDALRAAGWRIAIATNGSTAQQSAKIRHTGLASHVDAVAISEEVGAAKPDARMFEVAAQRCGARLLDGGWMVGDCPERDIAGAARAGLRTIWLRRGRSWPPVDPAPDAVVDDVPRAVERLRISGIS